VLFTLPSKGKIYDRDSSIYSRDAPKRFCTLWPTIRGSKRPRPFDGQFSMLSLDRAELD
jgi:hypothetical protein